MAEFEALGSHPLINRNFRNAAVYGRLKPGVTLEEARNEVVRAASQIEQLSWTEIHLRTRLPKPKHKQTGARRERDVLFAIHRVRHRTHRNLSAGIQTPQQLAGACIQGLEKSFSSAGKHQVRCGAQYAAGGHVGHFEFPSRFAGYRIHSPEDAIAIFFASVGDLTCAQAW